MDESVSDLEISFEVLDEVQPELQPQIEANNSMDLNTPPLSPTMVYQFCLISYLNLFTRNFYFLELKEFCF